jgi:hypothetical protein
MSTKAKNVTKIVKTIILGICITVLTGMILLSISPSTTVRMTMILSGHPESAINCNPVHDPGLSKAMNANIYTIQDKYGYTHLGMRHVVLFKIDSVLVFHTATATYRYF